MSDATDTTSFPWHCPAEYATPAPGVHAETCWFAHPEHALAALDGIAYVDAAGMVWASPPEGDSGGGRWISYDAKRLRERFAPIVSPGLALDWPSEAHACTDPGR